MMAGRGVSVSYDTNVGITTSDEGVRGHFASKSRRYSTTLGTIRGERRSYRQHQAAEQIRELFDEDTILVASRWNSPELAVSPLEVPSFSLGSSSNT
jgi:hypothetical protein